MTAAYRTEPDTLDAIRRDLDLLIDQLSQPRMTADDLGPPTLVEPGEPHTARSIGMGPPRADLADVVDLASLAAGRRRHAYRMAADAVDQLIALMDALDIDVEDMEEDDPAGTDLDGGEGDDADREHAIGWPEDFTARLDAACAAEPDAELDDVDLEDGDDDEDRSEPWPVIPAERCGGLHV